MQRQLLILDIDETLVYATETPLERPPDFRVGPFVAYRRPHLHKFIEAVLGWFDVAVWSSSTADYAAIVTANVFSTSAASKFVWARDRCTRRFNPETWQEDWIKDLRKVKRHGYPLERILAIDDSPEKLQRHYGNHIRVMPFVGDPADCELESLLPFLDWIRSVENVRTVEKRKWRSFGRTTPM